MPDAIIFDVDGTLVDSVDLHARSWQQAFHDFGHDIPFQAIREQIGKGGDQLMPVFLSSVDFQEQGAALEQHRKTLLMEHYLPQVRAFPRVRDLFERIRRDGMRIVLASSAKADELAVYKQRARIGDMPDDETSSDDAERSKPYPDIFQAALGRLGNPDPARVLVVGDSPWDSQAAARAGLRTVGLLCGGFPETMLREAGCIAIYRDPADLLAQYERSPLRRG